MNVFFMKIGGFGKKIKNKKLNVLSIIFYVKICADSKKIYIYWSNVHIFGLYGQKTYFKEKLWKIVTFNSIKTTVFNIFCWKLMGILYR